MTNNNLKQVLITKLFGKAPIPDDCAELAEEISKLEEELKQKQNELFQVQRNSIKRKHAPSDSNKVAKKETFLRPEKMMLQTNIKQLERNIELMSMLTGMEVKSYVANDHCVIVYHMQHPSEHAVEHGLRIDMKSDAGSKVSKFSLPLGFNFNAVVEEFDKVMTPECLGSLRKALVAYYDRQEQFQALKELVSIEAQLFKVMDGSHMEVSFKVHAEDEDAEQLDLVLMLEYRIYDIRPKHYSFKGIDSRDDTLAALKEHCALFKKKPLDLAFRECFLQQISPFKLVREMGPRQGSASPPRRRHRGRAPPRHGHDDTFRPEDCSDCSDEHPDEREMRELYGRR